MGKASRKKREAGPPENAPPVAPAAGDFALDPPWITRPLLWILSGAALFRILYYLQYASGSVFFGAPFLDASIYDGWARRIASGEWSSPEPFYFAPGYPYALALLYRFISPSLSAVYIIQMALGLLGIILIHRLTALAFGRRAATIAALLATLYASFPFLETKVMSSILALTLLLGSMLALAAAARTGGVHRWVLAGALLGLTSLVRPETLIAGPFILIWIFLSGRSRGAVSSPRAAVVACAAVVVSWGVAISPAAIHNIRTGGGSTLISSQGGITFYQSNNPRARGLYVFLSNEGFSGAPERQAQEEKEIAEKALARPLTRSEVSSYWFGKGVSFIMERPERFLWLLGMKLLRFAGSYEYSTEYIIYVERETVPLLWLPFVPFALIVALAVPAIARSLLSGNSRHPAMSAGALNESGSLLLFMLLANLCAVMLFYVSSRYRLPSAPPLMAFASVTVVMIADAWKNGRRAGAYALASVAVLLFLLCHFEKDDSATIQEANVHYNEGNIWLGRKDYDRAVTEFRRAAAMDDSRHETWFNMGNALRALRKPADAAESYARAARRRPQFFNAHLRQAQALEESGDWAGARSAYEKAEALHPDDFEAQLGLGRAAAKLGDRAAAVEHLDRALALRPGNPAAVSERSRL